MTSIELPARCPRVLKRYRILGHRLAVRRDWSFSGSKYFLPQADLTRGAFNRYIYKIWSSRLDSRHNLDHAGIYRKRVHVSWIVKLCIILYISYSIRDAKDSWVVLLHPPRHPIIIPSGMEQLLSCSLVESRLVKYWLVESYLLESRLVKSWIDQSYIVDSYLVNSFIVELSIVEPFFAEVDVLWLLSSASLLL